MKHKLLVIFILIFPLLFIFINVNFILKNNRYIPLRAENYTLYKEIKKDNNKNDDFITYLDNEQYIVDVNSIYMFRYSSNYILQMFFFQLIIICIYFIVYYFINKIINIIKKKKE